MRSQYREVMQAARVGLTKEDDQTIYEAKPEDYVSGEPVAGVAWIKVNTKGVRMLVLGASRAKRLACLLVRHHIPFRNMPEEGRDERYVFFPWMEAGTDNRGRCLDFVAKAIKHLEYHSERVVPRRTSTAR